jgi:vacuolar-type H+-ATPase subunit E/Vma4
VLQERHDTFERAQGEARDEARRVRDDAREEARRAQEAAKDEARRTLEHLERARAEREERLLEAAEARGCALREAEDARARLVGVKADLDKVSSELQDTMLSLAAARAEADALGERSLTVDEDKMLLLRQRQTLYVRYKDNELVRVLLYVVDTLLC